METLKIELKNKKQSDLIKMLLQELHIKFKLLDEKDDEVKKHNEDIHYDTEFVNKIKRGEKAKKLGKGTKVNMDNLWK